VRPVTAEHKREVRRAVHKRWREKNPEKNRACQAAYHAKNPDARRRNYLKRSGFTLELFKAAMEVQNSLCAICRTDLAALPSAQVHADHCHETVRPRGILCLSCNRGLGFFKDNPHILEWAAEYLRAPTISGVLHV
jgi:hypothetical protein